MSNPIKNLEDLLLTEFSGEARLNLLIELSIHLYRRDNHRALALAEEAYNLANELQNEEFLAKSLWCLGRAQLTFNQYNESEINLRQAFERFEQLGDQFGQAKALISLGNICVQRSQSSKALEFNLAALSIFQTLDCKYEQTECLINLGIIYSDLGDYAAALDYYLQASHLAQTLINPTEKEKAQVSLIPAVFLNLGDVLMSMERWQESLDYSQQALKLFKQIGNKSEENITLLNVGETHFRMNDHAQAQPIFENVIALSRELGDAQHESRAMTLLGKVQMALGDLELTRHYFEQGLALSRAIKSPREEMMALLSLGEHFLKIGNLTVALGWLRQALELGARDNLLTELSRAHELLVSLYKQQNDWQNALASHEQYHEIKQRLHGEKQNKRLELLFVQHEIEKTRQIAAAQSVLNDELKRANDELAESYRLNQELLEQVRHQAQHDSLTGLPNRSLFEDRLQHAVSNAARGQKNFAVMFLDLDGFKLVNDTLGHDAGDELLLQVARRFRATLRESDTIARLGGDEFTVIAENLTQPEDAAIVAQKLLNALFEPFTIRGYNVSVGTSIGISLYPQDGSDMMTLQKHADIAMYNVKHNGKRDMRFFSPGMNEAAMERVLLESQLRGALAREEFALHYQPQFDIQNGAILGFEALLRWTDAKLGAVAPDRFIPIAEDSGLIVSIGEWAFNEACRQTAEWRLDGHEVSIAVNVSPVQFARDNFIAMVAETLERHKLLPAALELELTERLMMRDRTDITEKIMELRGLGARVAMDDFGTGQSTLTYLLQLPVNTLKIDKTFVQNIEASPEMRKVVQAIIGLSHTMGLVVVAEGVETEEQLRILRELGCERTQGFLQGRPMPSQAVAVLLKQKQLPINQE